MKGAIIGDIVGSIYEWHNHKSKDFPLFQPNCDFTDDTVMTVAVAMGLLRAGKTDGDLLETLTEFIYDYGNRYPHRGYGNRFRHWLRSSDPQPYNSFGNGAPMRCSAAGMIAGSPEKAYELGTYTAAPTHNHPEGMKAAGVTAMLIWHARHGMRMDALRELAAKYYDLPVLDEIRDSYTFDVSSMGTMPVALSAFLESTSFEDAIRNAISVGGDSDTIAAITGSVAEAYYGVPEELWAEASGFLTDELRENVEEFYRFVSQTE
ncbi:MAG: ADP-ribosylglycohydrolase family protein [Oscillospiraceae bacterium]|nr:ADP-ribosylglycohydrolase family protein [Oscillospiraceae bacterium]